MTMYVLHTFIISHSSANVGRRSATVSRMFAILVVTASLMGRLKWCLMSSKEGASCLCFDVKRSNFFAIALDVSFVLVVVLKISWRRV